MNAPIIRSSSVSEKVVTKDHDSILDAIEKRDKIAFEKAIEQSLSTWKELALGEE